MDCGAQILKNEGFMSLMRELELTSSVVLLVPVSWLVSTSLRLSTSHGELELKYNLYNIHSFTNTHLHNGILFHYNLVPSSHFFLFSFKLLSILTTDLNPAKALKKTLYFE